MAWAFIEHATRYLNRRKLGDYKSPTLWPSEGSARTVEGEFVGKCRRATFFRYVKDHYNYDPEANAQWAPLVEELSTKTDPEPTYLRWIGVAGTLYEENCVQLAKGSGLHCDDQVQIYIKQHNVSGKIDEIAINPETGKFFIVEFKSVYGHGSEAVIGKPQLVKPLPGTPRDNYIIQLALYQWHMGNKQKDFEEARLVVGARDTGRYAEFIMYVDPDPNVTIKYRQIAPREYPVADTGITIASILSHYDEIEECRKSGRIPDKDFELQFSDEKILELWKAGELSKADSEKVEKRQKQILEGKKPNKQIEKGHWQCDNCRYKRYCYPEAK